jgi:hypothetical protein
MSIREYFGLDPAPVRIPQGRSLEERIAREQALIDASRQRDNALNKGVAQIDWKIPGKGGFSGKDVTTFVGDQQKPQSKGPRPYGGISDPQTAEFAKQFSALASTDDSAGQAWLENLYNASQSSTGGGGGSGGIGFSAVPTMQLPADMSFMPLDVDRELYQLQETAAERQALIDARADLDARARAGAQSIMNTWQAVEAGNRAAAEKAQEVSMRYGQEAASLWTNAANQAREASVLRAAAAMANAGRAPIDLDPMAGGGAFVAAMESLAMPEAERAFAEGQAQARGAEFSAGLASRQSAAYQSELQRTSMIMAADMARDHNSRVLERIGRERLALQEAERQTGQFNRQLQAQTESENLARRMQADQFNIQNRIQADQFDRQLRQQAAASAAANRRETVSPLERLFNATLLATRLRDPESLVREFGMSLPEANRRIANMQQELALTTK